MPTETPSPTTPDLRIIADPAPSLTGLGLQLGWIQTELVADGFEVTTTASPIEGENLIWERDATLALWSRAEGAGDTVLLGLTWKRERQLLLAQPGVQIPDVAGLRGARLGLSNLGLHPDPWRAHALEAYLAALDRAGLTVDDADFVNLPGQPDASTASWPTLGEQALLNGEVDIIYASGRHAAQLLRRHGLHGLDLNQPIGGAPPICGGQLQTLEASAELVRARPDIVSRYLAVLLQVADWAADCPAEVRRLTAQADQVSLDEVLGAYGRRFHLQFDVSSASDALALLHRRRDFLADWGLTARPADLARWSDPRPLEQARKLFQRGQVLTNLKEAV